MFFIHLDNSGPRFHIESTENLVAEYKNLAEDQTNAWIERKQAETKEILAVSKTLRMPI